MAPLLLNFPQQLILVTVGANCKFKVPDHGIPLGLNWRLMMGSAMIPAVIVCCLIPYVLAFFSALTGPHILA